MLYFFYTKNNKYLDFIDQYNNMNRPITLIAIEDVNNKELEFNNNDVVYLMLNDREVIDNFISKYKGKVKIINEGFYELGLTKLEVQKMMNEYYFTSPKTKENPNDLPYYFKDNNHQGINELVTSIDRFNELVNNKKEEYYLEEVIDSTEEKKLYYVYDTMFIKNKPSREMIESFICEKIQMILKLDIMSLDVLYKDNKRYIIDVNTSPAFYECEAARIKFISYTLKQMEEK